MIVPSNEFNRERTLPTYRWDREDKLSDCEVELRSSTTKLLEDFMRSTLEQSGNHLVPPMEIVKPIIAMNVRKRSEATRRAEDLIKEGVVTAPPPSLIPTFMAAGHEIPGLEDRYMQHSHPSQELFAYNRLGKKSWLNKRFGEHCLRAIAFAHPHGTVEAATGPTRIKAHSPVRNPDGSKMSASFMDWTAISTKMPIATIYENERTATLISRVTGAIDLANVNLTDEETAAIRDLSQHEVLPEETAAQVLAQKAILLSALERMDEKEDSAFHPVIQTVYLTQLPPKQ